MELVSHLTRKNVQLLHLFFSVKVSYWRYLFWFSLTKICKVSWEIKVFKVLQLDNFQLHTVFHKNPYYGEILLLRAKQSRSKNVLSRLYQLVFVCYLICPENSSSNRRFNLTSCWLKRQHLDISTVEKSILRIAKYYIWLQNIWMTINISRLSLNKYTNSKLNFQCFKTKLPGSMIWVKILNKTPSKTPIT